MKEAFKVLRRYNIKLNPEKCAFEVGSSKFIGFLVSNRGIEANSMLIKAIEIMPEVLKCQKEVMTLTGRIATVGRFISRSSEMCHKIFAVLKKNKNFEWTVECR